jgi:hypothetical protein
MNNNFLDKLVEDGTLKSYSIQTIEYEPGSGSRETEQLVLILPSGKSIVVSSFCSGASENTHLLIEDGDTSKFDF